MKAYINVCDVEKYYGSDAGMTKAVDRVSFQVAEGEFVGVMGASGSGKTTLLNMLSTIDSVTAGHIYYQDTDITELKPDQLARFRKENLGFVFQDYNLLDTLTIGENIALAMTLQNKGQKGDQGGQRGDDAAAWHLGNPRPVSLSGLGWAEAALRLRTGAHQPSEAPSGRRADGGARLQGGGDAA